MAVFRVEKTKDYTTMSNHHLKNRALSIKAKGLMSQMLSLPDAWDYTLTGLATLNRDGVDSIRTAIQELEKAGYIRREVVRTADGTFDHNVYTIYEEPVAIVAMEEPEVAPLLDSPALDSPLLDSPLLDSPLLDSPLLDSPLLDSPLLDSPILEKPLLENPTQSNTYQSSTKKPPITPQGEVGPFRSALFESFWKVYPRKVNRAKAVKAWDKLKPSLTLCREMAKALERMKASPAWQKDNGAFIPHPATWLNNRRWEDEEVLAEKPPHKGRVVEEGEVPVW